MQGKHVAIEETRRRRSKRRRVFVLKVMAVLACIALCGAGAVALAVGAGKGSLLKTFELGDHARAQTSEGGKVITFDGAKYRQKEGMTSVLLLGHDNRQDERLNGQTDFIMVVAMDVETGQVDLISIPRDTMVDVRRFVGKADEYFDTVNMQIAAAFAYGSDFAHSAENVCADVSSLLYGVPMNYYYVLDVNGVGALADAVGGVELTAIEDVAKTDMRKGETYLLKGEQARLYVTERDCNVDWSAMDRLERQKQFIGVYLDRLLEVAKGDPGVLLATYDALASYSTTNLGVPEFSYLASVFMSHGIDDLEMHSLSGESTYNPETGYEEFHPDRDSVYQTVLDVYYEKM